MNIGIPTSQNLLSGITVMNSMNACLPPKRYADAASVGKNEKRNATIANANNKNFFIINLFLMIGENLLRI